MRLKQTQQIRQTQKYEMVLRNFFVMTTSVILMFSLGLYLLISVAESEKSYAGKPKNYLVNNDKK